MKIPTLTSIATSKTGQRFYKWICDPKKEKFLNNTLPTVETIIVTSFYCLSTETQKDIPREQKNVLQWQNVLGGLGGMMLGSYLNRKVSDFADKLEPLIKPDLVDVHKVASGLKIGLPIVATAMVMRLLVPIVTTKMSTEIEDYNRAKKKKLNKIA